MVRILLVGFSPETEDYSDPDRPPEMTAEKVTAAIEVGLELIRERGGEVDRCFMRADESSQAAGSIVEQKLREAVTPYDCVVIGGGIHLPSKYLLCEAVTNAIHKAAPRQLSHSTRGQMRRPRRPDDGWRQHRSYRGSEGSLSINI